MKNRPQALHPSVWQPIGALEFLARQVVEGFLTGRHRSPFHGFSVEFAEHRHYRTGESTRFIDWKLLGRTDKLFVKRFEEETNLRCHLAIDASNSMLYRGHKQESWSKLEFAAAAAASLTEIMRRQRDASGLSFFDAQVASYLPAKVSQSHQHNLIRRLQNKIAKPETALKTRITPVLHDMAERLPARSLLMVFSDFIEPDIDLDLQVLQFDEALGHLKFKGHEVVFFRILHESDELDLNLGPNPVQLVDLETGLKLKTQPDLIQMEFKKAMHGFYQRMELAARKYKMDWVDASVELGLNSVLSTYLRKRAQLARY
jgi:hypothetical protein